MITYNQLSSADVFADCQKIFDPDKPAFLYLFTHGIRDDMPDEAARITSAATSLFYDVWDNVHYSIFVPSFLMLYSDLYIATVKDPFQRLHLNPFYATCLLKLS